MYLLCSPRMCALVTVAAYVCIARDVQAGSHRPRQGIPSFVSECRSPDRRGGPSQQSTGLGPRRVRAHLHKREQAGRGESGIY